MDHLASFPWLSENSHSNIEKPGSQKLHSIYLLFSSSTSVYQYQNCFISTFLENNYQLEHVSYAFSLMDSAYFQTPFFTPLECHILKCFLVLSSIVYFSLYRTVISKAFVYPSPAAGRLFWRCMFQS